VPRFPILPGALFVHATVVGGALVCAYAGWDLFSKPLSHDWLVLLALTVGSGLVSLRVPGQSITFSISDTFTFVAALLVGPSAGAITAAADAVVLSFRMENRRTLMLLFNIACLAISTWLAAELYHALTGAQAWQEGPLGSLRLLAVVSLFGGLHFALNSGLVAAAVAFEQGASIRTIWREHFSGLWVSSFGGTFAAMLMVVLWRNSTLEVLILTAPLPVILYVAMRHAQGRAEDHIGHLEKMNRVYVATIEALAQAVDAKDQVTHDHVRRVQENSLRLAGKLGVRDDAQLQAIKAASLLHDVGKIGIPEHILNKPGRLTPSEFEIMKRHAAIGADILSVIGFPYPLIPIVRHHHENWDGTGYPDRIAGEQIPIGARILQVVDCFDALTSDRPYRPAMTDDEALTIIRQRSGTMYDPRVVAALLELHTSELERAPVAARGVSPPPIVRPAPAAARPADERPRPLYETVADLGIRLAMPLAPARIGDAVWNGLERDLPAAAFVFFVYDRDAHALIPAHDSGPRIVGTETRVAIGERLSGWVAATQRSILNSDARLDFDADLRDRADLRSALAVPVVGNGEILGVLAFYAADAEAFTETHQQLAEAASYLTAHALLSAPRPALSAGAAPVEGPRMAIAV
jgi:putative nucleotidyltransferase with HDIG domain